MDTFSRHFTAVQRLCRLQVLIMEKDKNRNPEEFRKKLQQLLQTADNLGGHIAKSDVMKFFEGDGLSDDQMDLVYDFLLSKKIIVEGFEGKPSAAGADGSADESGREDANGEDDGYLWTEEDQAWLDDYSAELERIPPEKDGEWDRLTEELRNGSADAKRRIAELLLPEVVETARQMYEPGVHLADMIQEGSLNLVLYIDALDPTELSGRDEVRRKLMTEVREGILALLEEQRDVHTRDERMVERVEDLKRSITALKEQLGRKVYVDELAEYMNISEDEVEDILRLAGENIPQEGEDQRGPAPGAVSGESGGRSAAPEGSNENGESTAFFRTSGIPDRKGRKSFYNPAGRIRRR